MDYHPVAKKITDLLDQNEMWYETFEHEPVRTSEQAALTRPGYSLQHGAKAIVVRAKKSDSDKTFVMLVFPANLKFDSGKVKALLGIKDVRFANEDEVAQLTGGVQAGGVPPFGNLFGLETIADPKLFENEKIVFNAGDRRFSVAMKSADYRQIAQPQVISIVL